MNIIPGTPNIFPENFNQEPWYERYLWQINNPDTGRDQARMDEAYVGQIAPNLPQMYDAIRAGYKPDHMLSDSWHDAELEDSDEGRIAGLSDEEIMILLNRIDPRIMNRDDMLLHLDKVQALPERRNNNYQIYPLRPGIKGTLRPRPRTRPIDRSFQPLIDQEFLDNRRRRFGFGLGGQVLSGDGSLVLERNRRAPWRRDSQGRMLEPPEWYLNNRGTIRSLGGGKRRTRTRRTRRNKSKSKRRRTRKSRTLKRK